MQPPVDPKRVLQTALSKGPRSSSRSLRVQFAPEPTAQEARQRIDVPTSDNGAMRPSHAPKCFDATFLLEVRPQRLAITPKGAAAGLLATFCQPKGAACHNC